MHGNSPHDPGLDRSYGLDWLLRRSGPLDFEPVSDPLASLLRKSSRHNRPPSIQVGTIVDLVAGRRAYRVLLGDGHPAIVGVPLMPSTTGFTGARSVTSYACGDEVVVLLAGPPGTGYILGAVPPVGAGLPDYAHQAARCGLRVDAYHSHVLELASGGLVRDWSAGLPADSTSGEWGAMTETGLRIWLDPKMAQLAVDEATGLFVFYRDQLTRLAGINLQILSSGREFEQLDDEGELLLYDGRAVYPHEALGALVPGVNPFRDVPPEVYQRQNPELTAIEPAIVDQQPFHRVIELGGYLGQGGRRFVQAPPPGATLYRYAPGQRPVGLIDRADTLSGRSTLRAAKGIHLQRSGVLPVPVRVRRPEDPQGDNPQNYAASGSGGSGESHAVTADPAYFGNYVAPRRIASLDDLHAFVFNWEAQHTTHYHRQDWELAEEHETAVGASAVPIDFSLLREDPFLNPPPPVTIRIDDRYGEVKIYPNSCGLDLCEDGGTALTDGFGAQVHSSGGNLYLDAPGDIVIRPGRNLIILGGRDVIMRAHGDAELVAANGSVRVKAETDLQVLGGNGGVTGGVLVESRAPGLFDVQGKLGADAVTGGVVLKCAEGPVAAWGQTIYLRSGKGTTEDGVAAGGGIVIDAGAGTSPIVASASNILRHLTGLAMDTFADGAPGAIDKVNLFSRTGNVLAAGLEIDGKLNTTDGAVIANYIAVPAGHIFTELADRYLYQVVKLQDGAGAEKSLTECRDAVRQIGDDTEDYKDRATTDYRRTFDETYYAAQAVAADVTLRYHGFAFRSDAQYRTAKFEFHEPRWQRLARLQNTTTGVWTEPPVQASGNGPLTFPWPGKSAWHDRATLQYQDAILFDPSRNLSRPRSDDAYRSPTFSGSAVPPDRHYRVIDP